MSKGNGAMTVAEAGRKGGLTNVERYGHEHFVAMGKKGGARQAYLNKLARSLLEKHPELVAELEANDE